MWSSLKSFCKLIEIEDEKLFSKHKLTPAPACDSVLTENDKPSEPLKQQQQQQNNQQIIKSEKKKQSLSPQKYRPIEPKSAVVVPTLANSNINKINPSVESPLTPQASPNENINANNKRNVSTRESMDGQSQAKISKLDESNTFNPMPSKKLFSILCPNIFVLNLKNF